jgi:hypothetical protein
MIELPTEIIKATSYVPKSILLYSKPKQGKTSILAQLPNSLLIDTEDGSDFVDARKIKIDITKSITEQAQQFREICATIYKKGLDANNKYTPPYDYLIIDTFTRMDEWSEIVGTLNYMEKPQGSKFNVARDGSKISPSSKNFETVHDIGQGFGYKHSREVMINWYEKICLLAPTVIFVCHVKDKLVASNLTDQVLTREISLTGKVKDIVASKVDTIAYAHRDNNKLMLSFNNDEGTRCPYLSGKTICISESDDKGNVVTNWDQVFNPEKINK